MYERSLNEAELILTTRKVPLVSVREVWGEVIKRSKARGFEVASLADFSAMLEGDRRFQIIPAQNKNEEEQENQSEVEFADEEMESLGFFSEDRVRLRVARVVQSEINEDEEEVGSIRRRAFVSRAEKALQNKTTDTIKKPLKKENKSLPKRAQAKQKKSLRNKKSKIKRGGKK